MTKENSILLISANQFENPYPVFPLGVACLETWLQKHLESVRVTTFDMRNKTHEQLRACIEHVRPGYIGISLRNVDDTNIYAKNSFVQSYVELVRVVRGVCTCPVILGGAGYSIFPQILLDVLGADFGIPGEGEQVLVNLIQTLSEGGDPSRLHGLVYRKGNQIIENPPSPRISSPLVSYDPAWLRDYWQRSGMLNLQTKRGCPHHCIYCTYPLIDGATVRTVDISSIIDTLKRLKDDNGIDYVFFTDSVFNIQNSYNEKLAEAMIKADLKIRWGAFFAPAGLDRSFVELLRECGLTHVEFGTESLSNITLASYGKSFSVKDVIASSDVMRELGIHFAHFLILGGYGETEQTLTETVENARRIRNTVFFPFVGMRIYPGTPLAKLALAQGRISPEDNLLQATYYVSNQVDLSTLKTRIPDVNWVFPDADLTHITERLRAKGRKGPLWEYLIR